MQPSPPPYPCLVLGGGVAGLAAGHFVRQRGLTPTVFEKATRPGGWCQTLEHGPFRFDSGAHRLHDRDPAVTAELRRLLDPDLHEVQAPSCICSGGRMFRFPLAPGDLLRQLGCAGSLRAVLSLARARLWPPPGADFAAAATRMYGHAIARRFLLDYSEKLWGLPGNRLCPAIAGSRLKTLTLRTVLGEFLRRGRGRPAHMEGSFLYPRGGIGRIADALAVGCGPGAVRTGAEVTRVRHDGRRVLEVEINGTERHPAPQVLSTLPLGLLVRLLDPAPPAPVLAAAARLRQRALVLVALFLRRPSVHPYATVYLPDPHLPVTRICEPRNRSPELAPAGHTSLVAEIPCWPDDEHWATADSRHLGDTADALARLGWFQPGEVIGGAVHRVADAYPVLELGHERELERVREWLEPLENLRVLGRNGRFAYAWMHDMVRWGREAAAELPAGA